MKGFDKVERFEVLAGGDALVKLAQFVRFKFLGEFRLANEYDLQKLLRLGFKVGQQADLFEYCRFQILRFINDDDAVLPLGRLLEQIKIELVNQPSYGRGPGGNAKVSVDFAEQFLGGEAGVKDEGDFGIGVKLAEKAPADRGLPGSNLAGHHDEPTALADAIDEVGEGLLVLAAQEDKAGIWREIKGSFV